MGLSYVNKYFVVARDRAKKRVLLGGLGALGVGEMWFDEDKDSPSTPGFHEAPHREAQTAEQEREAYKAMVEKCFPF